MSKRKLEEDLKCCNVANGKCLILSYTKFKIWNEKLEELFKEKVENGNETVENADKYKMKPLDGNRKDLENMESIFKMYNFDIAKCKDKTLHETKEFLKKNISDIKKNNYDCLVVYVTSHGIDGHFYCDDEPFSTDNLFQMFSNDQCLKLADKPKCFFIDTCQGDKPDYGINLAKHGLNNTNHKIVPTFSDFLVVYSTFKGYLAYTNPSEGSWFTKEFCSVLEHYSEEKDLLAMLNIVNNAVSSRVSEKNTKQMPCFHSTLTCAVMFAKKTHFAEALVRVNEKMKIRTMTNTQATKVRLFSDSDLSLVISKNQTENKVISNLDSYVVKSMFEYKENGHVNINDKNAAGLLCNIVNLRDMCENYLLSKISDKTALDLLAMAEKYDVSNVTNVKRNAVEYIDKNSNITKEQIGIINHIRNSGSISAIEKSLNIQNVSELLKISIQFGLYEVKGHCESYLCKIVNNQNAVNLFILSFKNEATNLKNQTIEYIIKNPDIVKSEEFKSKIESVKKYHNEIYNSTLSEEEEINFVFEGENIKYNRSLLAKNAPKIEAYFRNGSEFKIDYTSEVFKAMLKITAEKKKKPNINTKMALDLLIIFDDFNDSDYKKKMINLIKPNIADVPKASEIYKRPGLVHEIFASRVSK